MKELSQEKLAARSRWYFWVLLWTMFHVGNVSGNNDEVRFNEKANLAIRRTAHLLLVNNGDSTSTVPPVLKVNENTFSIQLNNLFDYDRLPELLEKSLQTHGITRGYDVSVLDCDKGELRLGYNFQDLSAPEGVPCRGRQKQLGCYVLQISFYPEKEMASTGKWWLLPVVTLIASLGYVLWDKRKKGPVDAAILMESGMKTSAVKLGDTFFDEQNLTLSLHGKLQQLTYREAKLLTFFAGHRNQVLERDFILGAVWEDEGVIVGRSVDVFVSRLRKLLAADKKIKITAVHGVGYRLDES